MVLSLGIVPFGVVSACSDGEGETEQHGAAGAGSLAGERTDAGRAGQAGEVPEFGGSGGAGGGSGQGGSHGGVEAEPAGAAGAPSIPDALVLDTSVLPEALVKEPYSTTLEAHGGTGEGYVFRLSAGTLPKGVVLDEQGELHGTPTESGLYRFTVLVEDSGGATAEGKLQLRSQGRRWVVFRNVDSKGSTFSAVDVSTKARPRVALKGGADGGAVSLAAFSPDGRYLAFAEASSDGTKQLYLLGFAQETIASSVHIAGTQNVASLAWSPDSQILAINGDDANGKKKLFYLDVAAGETSVRGPLASTNASTRVSWSSARRLFTNYINSTRIYHRNEAGFDAAELFTIAGRPVRSSADPEGIVFMAEGDSGLCELSGTVLRFDPARTTLFPRATAFSNKLELAANYSKGGSYDIFPAENPDLQAPLAQLPVDITAGRCVGQWSHQGLLFAWPNYDELSLADLSQLPATFHSVSGPDAKLGNASSFSFSPDDRWLAFSNVGGELFVSRIEGGVPGKAQRVTPELPNAADRVTQVKFSSDSRFLAFSARQYDAAKEEVFVVSLEAPEIGPVKRVTGDKGSSAATISYLSWAPDSTIVVFNERSPVRTGSPDSDHLYAADALHPELDLSPLNQPTFCITDATACSKVDYVLVQP